MDMILYLWWWIVFLKWRISFRVRKQQMRTNSPFFFSEKYIGFTGYPYQSCLIETPDFLNHFWRSLWRLLRTSLDMSSAYHSKSDGQTEVTNRTLEDMLRCLVIDNIKTSISVLCQVEFAHNRAVIAVLDSVHLELSTGWSLAVQLTWVQCLTLLVIMARPWTSSHKFIQFMSKCMIISNCLLLNIRPL